MVLSEADQANALQLMQQAQLTSANLSDTDSRLALVAELLNTACIQA
jgi:hypothetical protein